MSKVNTIKLKELRKQKMVIQAAVAEAVGLGRTAYVKIENGTQDADTETLIKLADYFGVSVDYLLDRTDNINPMSVFPNGKFDLQLFKENSPGEHETSVDDLIKKAMELLSQMDEEHKKAALLQLEALAALNRK